MRRKTTKKRWAYSWSGENFTGEFLTREDAVDALNGEGGYVGTIVECRLSDFVNPDDVMEMAHERAWEEVWMDHDWRALASEGAKCELLEFLDDWAEKHGLHPNFWTVEDVEDVACEHTEA